MSPQVKAPATLAKDLVQFLSLTLGSSPLPVTPVQETHCRLLASTGVCALTHTNTHTLNDNRIKGTTKH